ncbi:MAG: ABC transporter ATP-binding protein [Nitrososphaerota archaeon]|nr:ABC transporter ATP-binding protein/permease [Nitrososphaerota archaeon]MCL5671942.1 ABC transporter ATP-binding protein/permease [Nitrososphaerota archaeon]MDG6936984.1 ABC transporter ATP-binding protein [Nitrososphaerota archaeon]MDG6945401.1 ABC transporter ATP-binding protein [Nitrososphaerota archaeon]MDG6961214.1 ABC transporter ATP-binding protein [Nitrososphaerota archaeon]
MGTRGMYISDDDPDTRKDRRYSDGYLIRKLVGYVMGYRRDLAVTLGGLLSISAVGIVGPVLLGFAVDDMLAGNYEGVALLTGSYALLYVANYAADNRRTYAMQVVGQNSLRDIRRDAFDHLQRLSPSYFSSKETGRIMSYIMNDVDAVEDFVTFQLPQVLSGFLTIVSIVIIMLVFNIDLSLVSFTVIPTLVVTTLLFQGRISRSFVETRKKIAAVTAKLQEGISGVRVTQAFVSEDRVSENFDAVNSENMLANLRATKYTSAFNSIVQAIEAVGLALVLWYGATEVLAGRLLVGTIVTFMLYVNAFFNPIIQLTTFYNSFQSAVAGLDRVTQLVNTQVEVKEPADPVSIDPQADWGVELRGVTFGYSKGPPVLNDINLKVEPREVVAIVGATGAGKSSIVSLVQRFYDPQQGSVLVGGVDLKTLRFRDFRGRMSVVPQDPILFTASVADNIRYGRPGASIEEVKGVARALGVDDFISSLPDGYATMVAEGATNLSMGQKQLICFARALMRDPKVLILDEATSGLDPFTELKIQRSLGAMIKGRTAIMVAHRLSTIRLADRIVVLDHGRVVEEGTFDQLVSVPGGAFAEMYALQSKQA